MRLRQSAEQKIIDAKDTYHAASRLIMALRPNLSGEAELLRKKQLPVDDEGRLVLGEFSKKNPQFYTPQLLQRAAEELARAKLEARNKAAIMVSPSGDASQDAIMKKRVELESLSRALGELLEMAITIAINQDWFSRDLVAVRSTEFDDWIKRVDILLYSRESGAPVAAIDCTADVGKKQNISTRIQTGADVLFGIDHLGTGVTHGPLKLPWLIVSLSGEEVIEFAKSIAEGVMGENSRIIGETVRKKLIEQCELLGMLVRNPEIRAAYTRTRALFSKLRA